MQSMVGKLLVASPYIDNPGFDRDLILVLESSERGSVGIVLNRPVAVRGGLSGLDSAGRDAGDPDAGESGAGQRANPRFSADFPLPADTPLEAMGVDDGDADDGDVGKAQAIAEFTAKLMGQCNVSIGGPVRGSVTALSIPRGKASIRVQNVTLQNAARILIDHRPRVFLGHVAWQPEELQHQVQKGVWLTLPARPDLVMGEPSEMWSSALRRVGLSVLKSALKLKHIPADPSCN